MTVDVSELLAQDIKHLTGRLDLMIREQAGEVVFRKLRQIRDLFTTTRYHNAFVRFRAQRNLISRLKEAEAYQIAHALSLFFQLVNLCEERARERRLRQNSAPPMSLRLIFRELREAGVSAKKLQIRFLARWRWTPEKQRSESLRRLLALTVNGIASGMKSTG